MQPNTLIKDQFRIDAEQSKALSRLGLKTLRDLLFHFPNRYGTATDAKNIADIVDGETITLYATVKQMKTGKAFRKKTPISTGTLEDGTGKIKAIWFHQPYIAKMIQPGMLVKLQGKAKLYKDEISLTNPEIEPVKEVPLAVGDSLFSSDTESPEFSHPFYPESKGISSRWFYHHLQKLLTPTLLDQITDPIPAEVLERYSLPTLKTALIWIHTPKKKEHAQMARKRFAFEEVFFIQVANQQERAAFKENPAFVIEKTVDDLTPFLKRFPFEATDAQKKSITQIMSDFQSGHAMSRLLEGDVGSGKTAVAATTAYAVVTTNPKSQDYGSLQVGYMAPTEILAKQHFESFINYFSHLPISIGLITGSGCKKFPSKTNPTEATDISRTQLLKWIKNGEIAIVIGTHALIQKTVEFKNLAYVIIDEQHRFGIKQRKKLRHKEDSIVPHLLSMTATPIPRTLALTIYGNLDLTLLDQMPTGRKPIITEIIKPSDRKATYEKIRAQLKEGRQAYIICPRINEPDPDQEKAINAKSVIAEAKYLGEEVFPEYIVDVLHSKMTPAQKENIMEEFAAHKTDILVATSIVEVGVNVPNATVIMIEGAERFGLSQLHQLRGRVIRSNHQAYCYVFSESAGEKTVERLSALIKAKNGFELAEYDLMQRGTGELSGSRQWGISDLAMEAIKNIKLVEAARTEAQRIVTEDLTLVHYPLIKERVNQQEKIHFE